MPHAVFEPAPDLERFWREFVPFKERRPDGTILEARTSYLRQDEGAVLVEGFSYELGPPHHFFVICDRKGERVTIRVASLVPVARTEGVIEIVKRIVEQFRALGGSTVIRTNLELEESPR